MNNYLAPTYNKLIGEYWVLWYEVSNSYSIVEPKFKLLLDSYLVSNSRADFFNSISIKTNNSVSESKSISETLLSYLKDCNEPYKSTFVPSTILDTSKRSISETYTFDNKSIQIYYCSELVKKTVHPALAHYCNQATEDNILATFDLYLEKNELLLFKDEQLISSASKHSYHIIQGKFIMQLLCTLYDNKESDWIGTFHGSTLTNGNSSILFAGDSGKGKSTLCALLVANGFQLLADDVSPLLSKDEHIYYNPSAISIKKGAFNLLQPLIPNFENLPIVKFNKTKGDLKYMPCLKPQKDHYPCLSMILVNYKPKAQTKLEPISVKTVLETIIPDSWLSPNPLHARQFLNWLSQLEFYQLTYSDTKSVTKVVSTLFQHLNKKL